MTKKQGDRGAVPFFFEVNMDSKRLLHSGQLYDSSLCDLVDEQQRLLEKLYDFNATRPSRSARRAG